MHIARYVQRLGKAAEQWPLQERHWKPICLANYMASRDFFTRVLHGYKDRSVAASSVWNRLVSYATAAELASCQDVFRLAFLKLNASNWLSPVRPGLVGGFLHNGLFFPAALVQPLVRREGKLRVSEQEIVFRFFRGHPQVLAGWRSFRNRRAWSAYSFVHSSEDPLLQFSLWAPPRTHVKATQPLNSSNPLHEIISKTCRKGKFPATFGWIF